MLLPKILSNAADLLIPPHFGSSAGLVLAGTVVLALRDGAIVVGRKNVGGREDGNMVLSSLERVLF